MLRALNVAILAAAWAGTAQLDPSAKRAASPAWLESLRRQLMRDNYDYLPKSSESVETTSKTSTVVAMRRTPTAQYSSPQYSPPEYAPVKRDPDSEEKGKTGQDTVSYNMDETVGHGSRRKIKVLDVERNVSKIEQPSTSPEPTPNVTLKLIRLSGVARRGGGGPRFVAEAGARGVALVSVDGAPFPAFRLPPAHRQYAHDRSYDLF